MQLTNAKFCRPTNRNEMLVLLGTETLGASSKEVTDDSGKKQAFTVCSLKFSLPCPMVLPRINYVVTKGRELVPTPSARVGARRR